MKNEYEMKRMLMSNAMELVADGGFEIATTKAITNYCSSSCGLNMNEVYIYRLFGSKEDLFELIFEQLDDELLYTMYRAFSAVKIGSEQFEDDLYAAFLTTWRFVLHNQARCRYYVRYYYSTYFTGAVLDRHFERYDSIVRLFAPLFKAEVNPTSIMHKVLTLLLDFAIRVYNGDLDPDSVNTYHVFNVLYCNMMYYFKAEFERPIPRVEGACG